MNAKAAIVAGITAAVLGGGGFALAQADDGATPGGTTQAADARAAATISRAEAERIALATAGGGLVREIELESEEGALVWKVEVIARGVEHDVYVDTRSGNVVRHRVRGNDRGESARDDDDLRHDVGDDHGGLRHDDIRGDDDFRGEDLFGDDHGDRHGDDGGRHGDDDGGHRHGGDDNEGPGEG
jgi:uncharacterized membrane protein YkoI